MSAMENINDMDKNKCTGCMACSQVCPVKAITCSQDEEGFYIPLIDAHKCVGCGRCFQRCPVNNDYLQEPPVDSSYIAQLKNSKLSKKSASGGAFIGIANWFLDKYKDGVVAGAAIGDDLVVRHYAVNDVGKLYKLQNTKYVQSCTDGIFSEIKGYLDSGRHVLFSGTPCQIAALYAILDDSEKEKIITVDLVCHGVPSPEFLKRHINYNSQFFNKEIYNYKFRVKKRYKSKGLYVMMMMVRNHLPVLRLARKDLYYHLFLDGLDFRESCYNCKYACVSRTGDFTIGDCDSQQCYPDFNPLLQNSIILLNSKKARLFWNDGIKNLFLYEDLDLLREAEYNHQLKAPFKRPEIRNEIYSQILKTDFEVLKNKYCGHEDKLDKYKLLVFLNLPDSVVQLFSKIIHFNNFKGENDNG